MTYVKANSDVHLSSYIETMKFLKEAEEERRVEANLKFMAKPYQARRILKQMKESNDFNANESKTEFNPTDFNKKLIENQKKTESLRTVYVIPTQEEINEFKIENSRRETVERTAKNRRTNKSFIKEVEINNYVEDRKRLPNVNVNMPSNKNGKRVKKSINFSNEEFRRKGTKTREKTAKQLNMELKMRKILKSKVKYTRRKKDWESISAEKLLRIQRKLENYGRKIYSFLKKMFGIFCLISGLGLLIVGLLLPNASAAPMLLIGAMLTLVGIVNLCLRMMYLVEASRKRNKYKTEYLSSFRLNGDNKERNVFI